MWQIRIIRYIPSNTSPMIFFDEQRLPTKDLYISPDTYLHRKRLTSERFDNMVNYADNDTECRSVVLQRYFGDAEATPCGVCDVCLEKRRNAAKQSKEIQKQIAELLKESPLTAREICREIKADAQTVAEVIEKMRRENKISSAIDGKLIIIE